MPWWRRSHGGDQNIDLTRALDDEPDSDTAMGAPGHCPACGGPGFLDEIDLVHQRQDQHCRDCGHRWSIPLDENADRR